MEGGKIRPIVVAGTKRLPDMPDMPSLLEEGYDMKGLGGVWIGIFAPKGTPRPMINKLADSFKKMLKTSGRLPASRRWGQSSTIAGPEEFEKEWREEYQAYKELANKFKKK